MTEKRGKIRSAMQEPEQSLENTALSWLDDESGEALLNRPYTRWGIPNRFARPEGSRTAAVVLGAAAASPPAATFH